MQSLTKWFRGFRLICCLPIVSLVLSVSAGEPKPLVYVGTYTGQGSEGIYAFRFDPLNGEPGSMELVAKTENPSFLTVDSKGKFLYAVHEVDTFQNEPTGSVSVFAIDGSSGGLTLLQQVPSRGAAPAHLSLDKADRFLLVANYNGGNVATFPVENDGRLGTVSAFVQNSGRSVNPERQTAPHAHFIQVTNDNRFALVADLGIDKVFMFRFDAKGGALQSANTPFASVDPGAGPRHAAFHPSGKFVYVLNELASTVTVFSANPGTGALMRIQNLSSLAKDFSGKNTAAEIAVDWKGRFLYVSNRGNDSVGVFRINPTSGRLTPVEWVKSGGKTPRHFAIDPSGRWLYVANQDSNNIKLFHVDPLSGRLSQTAGIVTVANPVCVTFVSLK